MAMGSTGIALRPLAKELNDRGVKISHTTLGETVKGNRGASYPMLVALAEIFDDEIGAEVGDTLEWFLRGIYNANGSAQTSGGIPRSLQSDVLAPVIPIGRKTHQRTSTLSRTSP